MPLKRSRSVINLGVKDQRRSPLPILGPLSMVHHVTTAGVPSFPQIAQVRNMGADGDGNSVSGSKASSAHGFPARTNRNPRKGTG